MAALESITTSRKALNLTYISVACVIVISVVGFVYKMTAPRVMSIKELVNNNAIMYEEPRTILPFELVSQDGSEFSPEQIQDKWTLLFFGFSHCPDFCPATLAILREMVSQLNTDLQKEVQVVMVSVDPSRDTPERLKEYFDAFQFDQENAKFLGVTGEFVKIKIMADNFHIPFQKQILKPTNEREATATSGMNENMGQMDHSEHMGQAEYTMIHGENIVLINPQGQYHGFFKPEFTVARLKATFRSIVQVYE